MIEAVSIAVHTANLTEIEDSSTAVVIGAGMIGLLALQAFRVFGCNQVFAVDVDEGRLALARELGANGTFQAADPDLISHLKSVTDGRGPEIAVETVGTQRAVRSAIACVRKGGTVTLIENLASDVEIPLQAVVTRQIRFLGSCASAGEYSESRSIH